MSFSSNVSLGSLRLKAQQKSDLENSPNLSTPEWNGLINDGYKHLYDLLISAYGNDWFINNPLSPYQFSLTGAQYYALPSDFYKLIGVDLQYSGAPNGWVTLRRFEEIDRNKYAFPNTATNFIGYTNLKYRLSGNYIEFIPVPMASQLAQLKYAPEPTSLQFEPICSTALSSTTVRISYPTSSADLAMLTVGMNVFGTGIPENTTIISIDTNAGTMVISNQANLAQSVVILYCWTDATLVDGISGWEKFIICDAAINAGIKQESVLEELKEVREEMRQRLIDMAEARDMGQACHVSDVLGANGYGYDGVDGGYGGMY